MTESAASSSTDTPRSSLQEELAAIGTIGTALEGLDADAQLRVFEFIRKRFGLSAVAVTDRTAKTAPEDANRGGQRNGLAGGEEPAEGEVEASSYSDIGALYDAAGPTTDTERALVAAYWFQVEQKQADWGSQQVNDALKNLGHGISNITRALGELISRKPNLVRQLQKSGSSKQARKTYRLTDAGIRRVREMINGAKEQE